MLEGPTKLTLLIANAPEGADAKMEMETPFVIPSGMVRVREKVASSPTLTMDALAEGIEVLRRTKDVTGAGLMLMSYDLLIDLFRFKDDFFLYIFIYLYVYYWFVIRIQTTNGRGGVVGRQLGSDKRRGGDCVIKNNIESDQGTGANHQNWKVCNASH